MAGVMVDSFHLRCFLRSMCSWWADISLCSMKLMVGGMWEKRDCLRAGESVKFGDWDIFKTVIVITGESTKYATAVAGFTTKYRDQLFTSKTDPIPLNCMLALTLASGHPVLQLGGGRVVSIIEAVVGWVALLENQDFKC